jgi:capsular polysaccharide biosynthesis protein
MSPPPGAGNDGHERQWLVDDVTAVEDQPADSAANLVSLGFLAAALRRGKWLWCVTAVVGLLVGAGYYLKGPHSDQASTTLLLTVGAEVQPGTAILEDQALAQTHTMAGITLRKLGLQESVTSFLGSYTVTPLTDRVLRITASAPSNSEAVRRANALATEFLTFRADQLRAEQQLQFTALDRQLSALRPQGKRASSDLAQLEQAIAADKAAARVTTANLIGGSNVLDAASPVPPHSVKKRLLEFGGGGFLLGLILGVIIIVLRALVSDRLRRRDDVAQALGAPVRSIPAMGVSRWLPGIGRRASGRYSERVVAYMRDIVPTSSRGAVALAVVPVDDPRVAAMSLVSLAVSCAQEGKRVVMADLCGGAPAAVLLGAKGPGAHTVSMDGARLVVAVPDPNEFAPAGPLRSTSLRAPSATADGLAAACSSADILLTLITLDPAVGGDHLATWAADAVVMVQAGRSSWTKIHAVGEMIRLAGTRLVSAVLVGADKADESLGVTLRPEPGRDAATTPGVQADAEGSLAGTPVGRLSDGPASMLPMDPPEHVGHRRRTGR